MSNETKKPETDATGTGNAGAAAKPAGAVAAAPAAAVPKEAMAKKAKATPEATVVVTGPEKGRWRIGRRFTREPSSISRDELTKAELAALEADPELHVQIVDAPH